MRKPLLNDFYLTKGDLTLAEKYNSLRTAYYNGAKYVILNNVNVFGPFPKPEVPWDISRAQKIATYNPEVTKVLTWIRVNIIINLPCITYRTLDVLIRIATGMLNKCNIPEELQIMFHDNMVENLHSEHKEILLSELPF